MLIRWVYSLSFIPWILSIWLFARTYSDVNSALYWLALSFLGAGEFAEKLWLLWHWETHDYMAASLAAGGACIFYVTASIMMGLLGGGGWQCMQAIIMTCGAAVWVAWLAVG